MDKTGLKGVVASLRRLPMGDETVPLAHPLSPNYFSGAVGRGDRATQGRPSLG